MKCTLISDLFTIQLTLIGISFSIFTIYFSLIIGKLEHLHHIALQIKSGKSSPEIKQSERYCLSTISRLKKTNRIAIIICSISIILSIILGIIKYQIISKTLLYIILGINCLEFLTIIVLIFWVFFSFFSITKYD